MNITNYNQSQFELFPKTAEKTNQKEEPAALLKDLTLSQENIIVVTIIFIMTWVLFFSFGVEKGKKIVSNSNISVTAPVVNNKNIDAAVQSVDNIISSEGITVTGHDSVNEQIIESQDPFMNPIEVQTAESDYFTIQVASFKTKDKAQKEASNLKEKGYEIFVLSKGNHSIVCVGKFAQRMEAKKFSAKLKNRYTDCLVRRF